MSEVFNSSFVDYSSCDSPSSSHCYGLIAFNVLSAFKQCKQLRKQTPGNRFQLQYLWKDNMHHLPCFFDLYLCKCLVNVINHWLITQKCLFLTNNWTMHWLHILLFISYYTKLLDESLASKPVDGPRGHQGKPSWTGNMSALTLYRFVTVEVLLWS